MSSTTALLNSIRAAESGLTLSELLNESDDVTRRTAQRLMAKLIESGHVTAVGEGRARRCFGTAAQTDTDKLNVREDRFPPFISLSTDSQDILAYIDQPQQARKPVGYQRDFLDAYRPNETWYLSESLRCQLHKMGRTTDLDEPAGTYRRAILNRLLIDLSWASSNLEGNTYSRIDTCELIEHGQTAHQTMLTGGNGCPRRAHPPCAHQNRRHTTQAASVSLAARQRLRQSLANYDD